MTPFRFQRRVDACRPEDSACSLRAVIQVLRALLCALVCVACGRSLASVGGFLEGMPLTRLYPLEEIGCTMSGVQLLHDSHGRVVVAQQDELFVLNDATWQRLRARSSSDLSFHHVVCGPDGEIYYSIFGAWGMLRKNSNGELSPLSLVPPDAPKWTRSCDFRDILCTPKGLITWGQDGIVFINSTTGAHTYFPIGGVSCVFPLKDQLIVATFQNGLFTLDIDGNSWAPTNVIQERPPAVFASAGDGKSSLLLATTESKFLMLQDGKFRYVNYAGREAFPGPISTMVALPEGGFAASVAGYGILLIDKAGVVARVLDSSDFRGVVALQSIEPGVLWALTERGVLKIMDHQPFTAYGRDEGILVNWPQLVRWRGRTIVCSGGRVFEAYAKNEDGTTHFKLMKGQPDDLSWGIAALGESLLIGGGNGVYETDTAGSPKQVLTGINVARLIAIDPNTCVVVATDTITAIRHEGGKWIECAEPIPGVGYPYVAHAGSGSAWLELGTNRVAQVSLVEGQLRMRLLEKFAWEQKSWVNVSIVGSTVVLSGATRVPMFLNALTLEPVEAPELRKLIDRAPFTLQRFTQDETGTLWISHARGLFPARLNQGLYEPDFNAFGGIKEAVPLIQCPLGEGIWASTEKNLYRLDAGKGPSLPVPIHPVLVSLKDSRAGVLLSSDRSGSGDLGSLRYAQNSLQLDFFAGSYACVRPFSYEYRLGDAPWERANAGSSVFLTDLSEGDYSFEIRAMDTLGPVGEVSAFRFSVQAPWYRSWAAYAAYPFAALLLVYLAMKYAAHRHKVQLAELERQVDARTAELRTTMDCLREEATTSATLAERNRLAGEIHDSLEQGFAGLLLQLESTARLPACAGPVRSGLTAAINMVQYCRDELRHAVRGLHSPVLDTASLETAIRRIATQLSPLSGFVSVQVEGSPRRINPTIEHHLLRIAQESLGNVVKHAGATKVDIVLGFTTRDVRLSVSDNGCGFNPAALREGDGTHLGLPSFERRARKIGGVIKIDSHPGRGTTVCLVVPEISSDGEQS